MERLEILTQSREYAEMGLTEGIERSYIDIDLKYVISVMPTEILNENGEDEEGSVINIECGGEFEILGNSQELSDKVNTAKKSGAIWQ